jgi:hypothetical protein
VNINPNPSRPAQTAQPQTATPQANPSQAQPGQPAPALPARRVSPEAAGAGPAPAPSRTARPPVYRLDKQIAFRPPPSRHAPVTVTPPPMGYRLDQPNVYSIMTTPQHAPTPPPAIPPPVYLLDQHIPYRPLSSRPAVFPDPPPSGASEKRARHDQDSTQQGARERVDIQASERPSQRRRTAWLPETEGAVMQGFTAPRPVAAGTAPAPLPVETQPAKAVAPGTPAEGPSPDPAGMAPEGTSPKPGNR